MLIKFKAELTQRGARVSVANSYRAGDLLVKYLTILGHNKSPVSLTFLQE